MVFDMHRHAFVVWIEARPLGYRPAFHAAVEFQPEVVVQARSPMFLNHKGARGFIFLAPLCGLRSDREIALGLVGFERILRSHRHAAFFLAGVLTAGVAVGLALGLAVLAWAAGFTGGGAALLPLFRLRCNSSVRS